jgi:hypothetical protein
VEPMPRPHCCDSPHSLLVQRFLERAGCGKHIALQDVIESLIEAVRRKRLRTLNQQLQMFLRDRNIVEPELVSDLTCDGLIEPIGSTFLDGFRIKLNKNTSPSRTRFTLAHEACHTFFYELVPELKFVPHHKDNEEERLCNYGAAALLIPASSIRRRVQRVPICLRSLEAIASEFGVSLPTMALRLRALHLWNCQLSLWQRMTDGRFVLESLYGGKWSDWEWEDNLVLQAAWESRTPLFGHTFVNYEDRPGRRRYKPVSYEVRRCLHGVIALWGTGLEKQRHSDRPLLTDDEPAAF